MTDKEQIIAKVNNVANIALYDINTYVWARTTPTYRKSKYKEEYTLGGGNIVSTAYIFNALNFLSKVHDILISNKRIFIDQSNVDSYEKVKEELQASDLWKNVKSFIKKPHLGDINEKDAFVRLCQNIDLMDITLVPTEWKDDTDKLKEIWDNWRNRIAHMGIQSKGSSGALELINPKTNKPITDYKKIKDFIKVYKGVSITDSNVIVEFLVRDIKKIALHIENLVMSKDEDSFGLRELITWLDLTDSKDFFYSRIY